MIDFKIIDEHFNAIYDAHPDAESILYSVEFLRWKNARPLAGREKLNRILEKGTASEVMKVFEDFKAETPANAARR